jgi:hypothetical protein
MCSIFMNINYIVYLGSIIRSIRRSREEPPLDMTRSPADKPYGITPLSPPFVFLLSSSSSSSSSYTSRLRVEAYIYFITYIEYMD